MKRLVLDLDDTICRTVDSQYAEAIPQEGVIERLHEYRRLGFEIVICTSRNVRTYAGNTGKINANTLPVIINWLDRHGIPYDEIYVAKPWCGYEGFYVDDKTVRPSEFVSMSYEEIMALLEREK